MFATEFEIGSKETDWEVVVKLDSVGVIADVLVNNVKIGSVNNLYRVFYLNVPYGVLKKGKNTLEIKIESTIRYTYIKAAQYSSMTFSEDYEFFGTWLTPNWVQFARTMAIDFGWDWSLSAAPQGIYGGVSLLFNQGLVLENPIVKQNSPLIKQNNDFVIKTSNLDVFANFRIIGDLFEPFIVKAKLSLHGKQIGSLETSLDLDNLNRTHNLTQKVLLG